ncbi:type VI secretion system tube protein TssD [Culturomica massiliensis]|uniref:type VI secretion system tube protein TssD n=1 Tax=Culturomica massiliensis TaxID=1841857 RepID=UPI003AB87D2B
MFGHKWFLKIGELSDSSISGLTQEANELINCTFSFSQGMDFRGQPQTRVNVDNLVLTYDGLPTQDIIYWAMTPTKLHNGACVLCDADGTPVDKLFFEDGACVGLSLTYINDGKSPSVITHIVIQPRKIISGDETITYKWLSMPTVTTSSNSRNNKAAVQALSFKIPQPIGKTSLALVLEDKRYEIERFNISFTQGIDHNGEPQEDTRGGLIEFSIASLPDKLLNRWMFKDTEVKGGVFVFEQGLQSSPLKINFTEAFCVHLASRTDGGKGLVTDYVITANEVDLNGKWLYKNFNL